MPTCTRRSSAAWPKLSDETIKRFEDEYQAAKPRLAKDTSVKGSWTALATASLAPKIGPECEQRYLDAFYKPTLEIHATDASVMGRLELTDKGILSRRAGRLARSPETR